MKAASLSRSTCEKDFVLKAASEGVRLDGRELYDYRNISIKFGDEFGHCQVSIGSTRVLAQVTSEIVKPPPNRAAEGQIFINVDLSPMASPQFENNRLSPYGIEINRFIERCIRESRPVDLESLCIVTGEKVWCLRVDVTVMDDVGNVLDCACIAAIAALAHYRYPDVTVAGETITVHSAKEKDPVQLNVYHFPICVSLGFIKPGEKIIVDPTSLEEDILSGIMMMAMNANREICCAQMSGGVFLEPEQIQMCAKLVVVKVSEITKLIKRKLEKDKKKRAPAPVAKQSISAKTFEEKLMGLAESRSITHTVTERTVIDITDVKRSAQEKANGVKLNTSKISEAYQQGPTTASIGEGGMSSWIILSDSEENEVIEVDDDDDDVGNDVAMKKASDRNGLGKKNTSKGIEVISIGSDQDSEEEETTIISAADIGSQNKAVSESEPSTTAVPTDTDRSNERIVLNESTKTSRKCDKELYPPNQVRMKKSSKKKKKEKTATSH